MENSAVGRVITLIDMDCFYCQVELRLDPSLAGKPVAVVQYNQWKQGGIIAVNYAARDRGVTRFMRGEEAKKTCPELCLPSVPCVRGKADLTRYREAGAEVAEVFASFSDCVERASIDEAFIDLTAVVDERIRTGAVNLDPEKLSSTFVVGYSDLKTNDMEGRLKGTLQWVKLLRQNPHPLNPDYRLAVGALIVEEIRCEVLRRTGFHCSAGIAHNKILAKLVAGIHKPKCQTVISHENVPELYETLPIRKVRSLGGKFGKAVSQKLSISSMSELYNFTKEELIEKFNVKNGTWLFDIARGIDHDPVTSRLIPESIGCSKNFRGPTAIRSKEKLVHWLKEMASEVVERLEKDQTDNVRRAKLLTVSFKLGGSFGSRSCPLPAYKPEVIARDALDVLTKFNQAPPDSTNWEPPIENLGLSASKFVCVKSTIKNFLKEKVTGEEQSKTQGLRDAKNTNSEQSDNFKEPEGGTSGETSKKKLKTNIRTFFKEKSAAQETHQNRIEAENTQVDIFGEDEASSAAGVEVEEEMVVDIKSLVDEEISREESNVENIRDESNDNDSHTSEGEVAKLPIQSFFAKMLAQKATEEPKLPDVPVREAPSPSAEENEPPLASTSREGAENCEDEWMQTCQECKEKIHLSVYIEHLDYHTAVTLDRALNGRLPVKTAPLSKSPVKKGRSPIRKKRKIAGRPSDQKEITTFFTVIPKVESVTYK